MAKQFTLGKNERLKSRKQIEQLFKIGKSFSAYPFRVYFIINEKQLLEHEDCLRFGVGVSAKNFKKAVDRNRVKRLIREVYRLQKNELQVMAKEKNIDANLFFIYTGKEIISYQEMHVAMTEAIKKLLQKLI